MSIAGIELASFHGDLSCSKRTTQMCSLVLLVISVSGLSAQTALAFPLVDCRAIALVNDLGGKESDICPWGTQTTLAGKRGLHTLPSGDSKGRVKSHGLASAAGAGQ